MTKVEGIGVKLDSWKHKMTGAHYLTLMGHYIISEKEKVWKILLWLLVK
jgi:hypothetical protein